MEIHERLKELRKTHSYIQKDISDYLNISKSAYGYYEQGRNEMDIKTILKLSDFYNVSTDYLLGKVDVDENSIQKDESELLTLYRKLNRDSKNVIFGALYALSIKDSK